MKKLIILLFSISYVVVSAQSLQQSILVLPYNSSGESALDLYENTSEYKDIIIGIEQVFIDRGSILHNLQKTILDAREQMVREGNKYKTIEDVINQNNSSLITIAAEIDYRTKGRKRSFRLRLKAIETLTGTVLYTGGVVNSPSFPSKFNLGTIATNILTKPGAQGGVYIDKFLNGMQSAIKQMIEYGQEVTVIIKTDDDSNYLLNQEANDNQDMISEIIDEWVASKAVNGNFRYEEVSKTRKEIYIRLKDLAITPTVIKIRVPYMTDEGKPYSVRKFAKEFRKVILQICWQASKTMGSENKPDGKSMHVMIDRSTIFLTMPAFR